MNFWQYQSANPWSRRDGTLTDQSRLWLNALFKTVTTEGEGPVQLGGDIGGTSATPVVIGLQGKPVGPQVPTNGQVLSWSSTDGEWEPKTAASGTVTSVGLSMPAEFSVANSPITGAGALTVTKANEPANTHFAGPASGAAAAPTFRALVAADLPAGTGTVTSVGLAMPPEFSVSGSPVIGAGTLTAAKTNQNVNTIYAGPTSGAAAQPTFRVLASTDVPAASTSAAGSIQLAQDLGGTSALPKVVGLQARSVAATAPTDGQLLTWVAANNDWEPQGVPTSNLSVKGVLVGLVNVSPILVNGHAIS